MPIGLILFASLLGWLIFTYLITRVVFKVDLIDELLHFSKDRTGLSESALNLSVVRDFLIKAESQAQKILRGEKTLKLNCHEAKTAIDRGNALFYFSDWEKREVMTCLAKIVSFQETYTHHPPSPQDLQNLQKEIQRNLRKINTILQSAKD